jgi:hypothetical protein
MRQKINESLSKKQYAHNWVRRRYNKVNDLLNNFLNRKLDESFFRKYGESKKLFIQASVGATYNEVIFKLGFNPKDDSDIMRHLIDELINLYSHSENLSKVYDKFSKRF